MNKKKILITGVSGLLGSNLAYYFRDKYDVLGIFNTHPFDLPRVRTGLADLTVSGECQRVVRDFNPDVCIHCAALADIDRCESEKLLAYNVNVEVTRLLVNALKGTTCKLIYISTDAVYNGEKGNFSENDQPFPLNYYAETKLQAEKEASYYSNALIVRVSFFGWNLGVSKVSIAEWAFNELSAGRKIQGFTDVITSSMYIFDLAYLLEQALVKDLEGIFNFSSVDSMSKDQLVRTVARLFALDVEGIESVSVGQGILRVRRSKNLSMSSKKLSQALGVHLPTVEQGLERFYRDRVGLGMKYRERE